MLNASTSEPSASEPDKAVPRLFARPRNVPDDAVAPPPAGSLPTPAPGEVVLPIDFAKTFIGPNGTYYDERWRWMDWLGRNRSWNWAAASTFGGWLAYRRLYRLAALHLAWLGLLLALALNGAPLPLVAILLLAGATLLGLYGNTLYLNRFKRAAVDVAQKHGEHRARLEALAGAGGTSRGAAWAMAGAALLLAALVAGASWMQVGRLDLYF